MTDSGYQYCESCTCDHCSRKSSLKALDIKSVEKLPIVLEAVQLTAGNIKEVADWCGGTTECDKKYDNAVLIGTLEGTMRAVIGSWVIKGTEAEYWPVKESVFNNTYVVLVDSNQVGQYNSLYKYQDGFDSGYESGFSDGYIRSVTEYENETEQEHAVRGPWTDGYDTATKEYEEIIDGLEKQIELLKQINPPHNFNPYIYEWPPAPKYQYPFQITYTHKTRGMAK